MTLPVASTWKVEVSGRRERDKIGDVDESEEGKVLARMNDRFRLIYWIWSNSPVYFE